jgi:hypothetical protein
MRSLIKSASKEPEEDGGGGGEAEEEEEEEEEDGALKERFVKEVTHEEYEVLHEQLFLISQYVISYSKQLSQCSD